ncbi:MAG: CHAT domain-containing protein, partial [Gammaproteobacteria bacterium]|nr:CHAT domain-containing protein [Gammaproteobacteria bacterium]
QLAEAHPSARAKLSGIARQSLLDARQSAERIQDSRALSHAYGRLGQLYKDQPEDAVHLTRQALFHAGDISELACRWSRQLGSLFKAQGKRDRAIEMYYQALAQLQPIRRRLTAGSYRSKRRTFREAVVPVCYELADLLLQRAKTKNDQQDLRAVPDVLEQVKAAQLENYFQDDCVANFQRLTPVKKLIGSRTAVFYPILLPDRSELLFSFTDGLHAFAIPVKGETINEQAERFRVRVTAPRHKRYRGPARRLYDWLIAPAEAMPAKHGIDTLVIAPDGMLRNIPFAALHDGSKFLIEKYATAVIPGLTLTAARKISRENIKILLGGISEPMPGFGPLPRVPWELENIRALYDGRMLLNKAFTLTALEEELARIPYSILHIASHARFHADPRKTFLLTYDGNMHMDRLEQLIRFGQFQDKPLDLITLSACETAKGDDRAALGLAGMAVKAGANSVLAGLWMVDDTAAAELSVAFYRELRHGLSKARALQRAQQSLLKHPDYRHPSFWAPFLLIGNRL